MSCVCVVVVVCVRRCPRTNSSFFFEFTVFCATLEVSAELIASLSSLVVLNVDPKSLFECGSEVPLQLDAPPVRGSHLSRELPYT